MKISKYENKVLNLLNKEGLENEKKKLNRETYVNFFKTALLYSASVLTLASGLFFVGQSEFQLNKKRQSVDMYDDNKERMEQLENMKEDLEYEYFASSDDKFIDKTIENIENVSKGLKRMNTILETSEEYITQKKEEQELTDKLKVSSGVILCGMGGLGFSALYYNRKKKNLIKKRETLNQYL